MMGLCSRYTILTSSNTACRAGDFLQILCKTKSRLLRNRLSWQGQKDSNPQQRFWRPTCYHYTMPLCCIQRTMIIIHAAASFVNRLNADFSTFWQKIWRPPFCAAQFLAFSVQPPDSFADFCSAWPQKSPSCGTNRETPRFNPNSPSPGEIMPVRRHQLIAKHTCPFTSVSIGCS